MNGNDFYELRRISSVHSLFTKVHASVSCTLNYYGLDKSEFHSWLVHESS